MPEFLIWSNEHGAWLDTPVDGYVSITRVIEQAGRRSPDETARILAHGSTDGTTQTVVREGQRGEQLSVPAVVAVPVPDPDTRQVPVSDLRILLDAAVKADQAGLLGRCASDPCPSCTALQDTQSMLRDSP